MVTRPLAPGPRARAAAARLARHLGPDAPRLRDRATQGRVRFNLGARAINHAVLAVRTVGVHKRSRGWLAAAAASIGVDLVLTRLLEDPDYLPGWPHAVAEWLDCALWSAATEDRGDMLFLLTAATAPAVGHAAVDAVAGTDAVPVYDPARPWPPLDAPDAAARLARVAVAAVVPTAIAVAIRGRRRLPTGAGHIIWSVATAGLAAFGARARDRLQADERRRWTERTSAQVHQEFSATKAELAIASSPGHDFKATLFALGLHGSTSAMTAARAQTERPAQVLADLGGRTLFDLTRSTRIVPEAARTLWLTDRQCRQVQRFLREAEETAVDGADQALRVQRTGDREITIAYLGGCVRLRNDPPVLRARLDPTASMLAVAAFMAADTVMTGELPAPAAAPSVALLLTAAWRFRRRAPSDDELDRIIATCAVSTVLGFLASSSRWARLRTPFSDRAMPAGSFAKGLFVVVGAHWSRCGGWRRAVVPLAFAGWAGATLRREPRSGAELLAGAIDLLQGLVCSWRLTDLVDGEVAHLEAALQAEFTAACEDARRAALEEELDRYERQHGIARHAIRELNGTLVPDFAEHIERACIQLAEWLTRQRAAIGSPAH